MPGTIRLSFSGRLNLAPSNLAEREQSILGALHEQAEEIASEISERIGETVGATPKVSIDFFEGTVEWLGWIEWVQTAWPWVEAISDIGGAIGLIQLVKTMVDSVLRRRFRRLIGPHWVGASPSTRVVLISGPKGEGLTRLSQAQQSIWGLAALVTSFAALLASVALLIYVLR